MQNSKALERLEGELELYNMGIEDDAEDANSYYMKAGVLLKLANYKQGNGSYEQALECYNKAIEIEGDNPLYLVDRSKLYATYFKDASLALRDIESVLSLPESEGVTGIYIKNTLREVTGLEFVQAALQNPGDSGQGQSDFSGFLQTLILDQISYDNELLNRPELLNEAILLFGFNKALDLSLKLSPDTVIEAMNDNDAELVLAGLLSLDTEAGV